jgi:DNA-binding response OmpR family regulator
MSRRTILVVEDQDDVRNSLAKILVDQGYEVVTALDGEDGLRM